jgi:hypothetical protein
LLFVAYFLEVGVLLVFLPWFPFWERNYFSQTMPLVGMVMRNPYVRGAVSGLGVISIIAGLAELAGIFFRPQDAGPDQDWPERDRG